MRYLKIKDNIRKNDIGGRGYGKINLQINESIAKITSEIDNKICDIWKINKQDIIDVINFKEKLIKHLEEKINELIKAFNRYECLIEKSGNNE